MKVRPSRRPPLASRVYWSCASSAKSWSSFERDCAHFWVKCCAAVREVMDDLPHVAWDSLFCNLSVQGSVTVDPGNDKPAQKLGPVTITMSSDWLAAESTKLAEIKDEKAWWRKHQAFEARLRDAFFEPLRSGAAKEALNALKKWHPCKLMVMWDHEFSERKPLRMRKK